MVEVITKLYAELAQSNIAHARMVGLWFFSSVDMHSVEAAKIGNCWLWQKICSSYHRFPMRATSMFLNCLFSLTSVIIQYMSSIYPVYMQFYKTAYKLDTS